MREILNNKPFIVVDECHEIFKALDAFHTRVDYCIKLLAQDFISRLISYIKNTLVSAC